MTLIVPALTVMPGFSEPNQIRQALTERISLTLWEFEADLTSVKRKDGFTLLFVAVCVIASIENCGVDSLSH